MLSVDALRARCIQDPATHCWLWQGACNGGSPRLYTFDHALGDKRVMTGTLAAWNIAHGEAPPLGKLVFRGCGQKLCLNPAHLRLARTKAEIGQHWHRAGFLVGTHLTARRANIALAHAVSGHTATSAAVVLAIRAAPASVTGASLALLHGVCTSTISKIRRGISPRQVMPQSNAVEGSSC